MIVIFPFSSLNPFFFFFNSVQVTSALQLGGRQLNVEWGGKNAVLNRRGVTEEFDC